MARTKGMLNLSGNLEVNAGAPLDARTVVPTVADLTVASNFQYKYVGMPVVVQATGDMYILTANDVTVAANWKQVGSGGGGGTSYTAGDGIVIDNDEISVDEMASADMSEIITPLPSVGARLHTYSEDEQIVAYWVETVNGVKVRKNVYEKMISVSAISANQNYYITVTDLNISKIIYLGGRFRASNYTQQGNLPFVHQTIAEYGITIWFDDSTNKIGIHTGTGFSIQTANVIVQYTKTTDQGIPV